jgi:hypothetical protein
MVLLLLLAASCVDGVGSSYESLSWRLSAGETESEQQPQVPATPPSNGGTEPPSQQPQLPPSGEWFSSQAFNQAFDVPWGGREVALGILGWAGIFVSAGLLVIPVATAIGGPDGFKALSAEQKALLALGNQVVETAVSIWAVRFAVREFSPLIERNGLFKYDFR